MMVWRVEEDSADTFFGAVQHKNTGSCKQIKHSFKGLI